MHDQRQLVEVDLILQKRVGVPRHLDEELVLEVFGYLWVLQAMLVSHCLQQRDLLLVMRVKLALVLIKEVACLTEELLEDHVQVQADEDWK